MINGSRQTNHHEEHDWGKLVVHVPLWAPASTRKYLAAEGAPVACEGNGCGILDGTLDPLCGSAAGHVLQPATEPAGFDSIQNPPRKRLQASQSSDRLLQGISVPARVA